MTRNLVLVTVILALSGVGSSIGKSSESATNDRLPPADTLKLIRMLGTTEADAFSSEARYLSLERILQHRLLRSSEHAIKLSDSTTGVVKDYQISIVVSADGKHFGIALVPHSGCGPALFSDESALIYQGAVLGCPDH